MATVRRLATRSTRKVQHYSCDSCRSRKLRCDRPIPCANCVSREKECLFSPVPSGRRRTRGMVAPGDDDAPTLAPMPCPSDEDAQAPPAAPESNQEYLLAEIQAVKKLVLDLESRVNLGCDRRGGSATNLSSSNSITSPGPSTAGLDRVGDAVAHLERVSMSQDSRVSVIYPSSA